MERRYSSVERPQKWNDALGGKPLKSRFGSGRRHSSVAGDPMWSPNQPPGGEYLRSNSQDSVLSTATPSARPTPCTHAAAHNTVGRMHIGHNTVSVACMQVQSVHSRPTKRDSLLPLRKDEMNSFLVRGLDRPMGALGRVPFPSSAGDLSSAVEEESRAAHSASPTPCAPPLGRCTLLTLCAPCVFHRRSPHEWARRSPRAP